MTMPATAKIMDLIGILRRTFGEISSPLIDILRSLRDDGIGFIIINLPLRFDSSIKPNDVDLLLDSLGTTTAIRYLQEHDYVRLDMHPGPGQSVWVRYYQGRGYVRLHLHADLCFFGTCLIAYEQACQHTVECDGFLVADAILDWYILHIEWLFRKKPHYAGRMAQVAQHLDIAAAEAEASILCGRQASLVRRIINVVRHGLAITTPLQMNLMLSHRPFSPAVYRHVLSRSFAWLRWPSWGRRKGLLVFFMGIDGTGKSTIAKSAQHRTQRGGFRARYEYLGLKETLVQRVRQKLLKRNDRERFDGQSGVTDSLARRSRVAAQMLNMCLAAVYVAEYRLRTARLMRVLRQRSDVILVDRTYYDKLTELRKWGNGMFYNLLPKPDVVIALHGDSDLLYARKPEFEVPVLIRMQEAMERAWSFLDDRGVPVRRIDTTTHDIESCCEIVSHEIWQRAVAQART